jgi:hypothetical protein
LHLQFLYSHRLTLFYNQTLNTGEDAGKTMQIIKRILKRTKKVGSCIVWQGAENGKGYGLISIKGVIFLVHRLSYMFTVGPIAHGMFVCHKCDNPLCVKPEHLFLGTAKDNWKDSHAKGRTTQQAQEKKTKHGTRSMYYNGCKCEHCMEAVRQYSKQRRKLKT